MAQGTLLIGLQAGVRCTEGVSPPSSTFSLSSCGPWFSHCLVSPQPACLHCRGDRRSIHISESTLSRSNSPSSPLLCSFTVGRGWELQVLCSDCSSRQHGRSLTYNRKWLLTAVEAGCLGSWSQLGQAVARALFWVTGCQLLTVSSPRQSREKRALSWVREGTDLIREGSTLISTLILTASARLTSLNHHCQGVGAEFQHEFWGNNMFSPFECYPTILPQSLAHIPSFSVSSPAQVFTFRSIRESLQIRSYLVLGTLSVQWC